MSIKGEPDGAPLETNPAGSGDLEQQRTGFAVLAQLQKRLRSGPTSANVLSGVVAQGALLVAGVLSARVLGPENRGYLALLVAFPSVIVQLGAAGVSLATTYYLAAGRLSGLEAIALLKRPIFVQLIVLTAVNAAVVSIYVGATSAPIIAAAAISLLQVPSSLAVDYSVAFLLGVRRHQWANVVRTLAPITYATLLVGTFIAGGASLTIVVTIVVLASLIAALAGIRIAFSCVRGYVVPDSILETTGHSEARRSLLAFGRQGYFGYLSPLDTFRLDQILVGVLLSPTALGYYAVAAAFTTLSRVVAANLGLSATPEIASEPDPVLRARRARRSLIIAVCVLSAINLTLVMAVEVLIPLLFGHQYDSAIPIAQLLLLAGLLLAVKRVVVDLARGMGETAVGTHAELLNLLVFFLMCVPLATVGDGVGVAAALVAAAASGVLLLAYRVTRSGLLTRGIPAVEA